MLNLEMLEMSAFVLQLFTELHVFISAVTFFAEDSFVMKCGRNQYTRMNQ